MKVDVTCMIHIFTLGNEEGFHPTVVGASYDPKICRCKDVDYRTSRLIILKSNLNWNRAELSCIAIRHRFELDVRGFRFRGSVRF